MYKALFFDVDDTLLNFKLCSQAALSKAIDIFGIPHDQYIFDLFYEIDNELWAKQKQGLISVQNVLDSRFNELFTRLGINVDSNKFKVAFLENLSNEYILEPGAYDIIRYLSSKYKLYVASNGMLTMQQSRLKQANLFPYFSDLFVSDDIGYEKPDIHFFEECLQRSGLKNKDVLFIGDSLEADILGAHTSGIDTCWYNPTNIFNHKDLKIGYIIEGLHQLKDIL